MQEWIALNVGSYNGVFHMYWILYHGTVSYTGKNLLMFLQSVLCMFPFGILIRKKQFLSWSHIGMLSATTTLSESTHALSLAREGGRTTTAQRPVPPASRGNTECSTQLLLLVGPVGTYVSWVACIGRPKFFVFSGIFNSTSASVCIVL